MAKFTDYTQKTKPADADLLLIHDNAGAANKKTPFSGVWSWILDKLASAVISQLETTNKSIIPAINELNSKSITNVAVDITNDSNIDDLRNGIYFCNGYVVSDVPRYGTLISAKTANGASGFQCIIPTTGTIIIRQYGKSTSWSEWA